MTQYYKNTEMNQQQLTDFSSYVFVPLVLEPHSAKTTSEPFLIGLILAYYLLLRC